MSDSARHSEAKTAHPFRMRITVLAGETYSNELGEQYVEHRKVTGVDEHNVQYDIVHGRRTGSTGACALHPFWQWQRKLLAKPAAFWSPMDMQEAHEARGAMCGHGAFAAVTGKTVKAAMNFFGGETGADVPGWVNVPMMKDALRLAKIEIDARKPELTFPRNGVVLLQWNGPWMGAQVPFKARCAYRHWVATAYDQGVFIWDANFCAWLRFVEWAEKIKGILPARATGWEISHAIEVMP